MLLNQKAYDFIEAYQIDGHATEFVVQKFSNKVLVMITQFGKIGNFYSVKSQVHNEDALLSAGTRIFDIQQKFGAPSMEVEGAIRYLMNFIGNSPKEILICLAVKDPENLSKASLDNMKDVLLMVPVFAQ